MGQASSARSVGQPMEAPHTGACWFSFGAAVDLVTEIKPAGALERLKVHTLRSGPPVPVIQLHVKQGVPGRWSSKKRSGTEREATAT